MKAAVLHNFGETPRYEDFADPIAAGDEKIITVKAVVLENVIKTIANGTHYSSEQFFPAFPAIIGFGGIGATEDGQLVGFGGLKHPYGAFAEKAAVRYTAPIPEGIGAGIAAALPASTLTSLLPLKHTAKLEKGETVLINGATGVAGKLAVQVAKMLGAGKVIATGRNEAILQSLRNLGADVVINLQQPDETLLQLYKQEAGDQGINIVIDYIWGHPAEVLIKSFVPTGLGFAKNRIRYVHIGEKAGRTISLSGEMLRTSGLEMYGAGNVPPQTVQQEIAQVWEWIKENKLQIDIEVVPLSNIEAAWHRNDLEGKRLVIVP